MNENDSVIITPADCEAPVPIDDLVLSNFKKCISILHQRLLNSTQHHNDCYEEGMLFETKNPMKSNVGVQYWVIGRLLSSLPCKELYVCVHESVPQNMVELAFKISRNVSDNSK